MTAHAQDISLGTWRLHLDHSDSRELLHHNDFLYVRSAAGLYRVDLSTQEVEELSKSDGLSSLDLSAMAGESSSGTLLFGYANGLIDIIREGEISTFRQIARSQLSGGKQIDDLAFYEGRAYAAGDFGVAVIDPEQGLLIEAYTNLSPSGARLAVRGMVFDSDSLYLGTATGVIAGLADGSVNLLDFGNWRRYGNAEGLAGGTVNHINRWQGSIFACIPTEGVYRKEGGDWSLFALGGEVIRRLVPDGERLLAFTDAGAFALDAAGNATAITPAEAANGWDFLQANGDTWVADGDRGLLRTSMPGVALLPDGPASNDLVKLVAENNQVLALGAPAGFSVYNTSAGRWENQLPGITEGMPAVADIVDATFRTSDRSWWLGSERDGILIWKEDASYEVIDDASAGSTLRATGSTVSVPNLDADPSGNVWALNANELHKISPDGLFEAFVPFFTLSSGVNNLLAYANGDVWLSRSSGSLAVFNESGAQALLNDEENEGGLPGDVVNDLTEDRRGRIWLAGSDGVAFFAFPAATLGDNPLDAIRPIVGNQFLFRSQNVRTIVSDGGNRKWVGTSNGLFLVSDDGTEQIAAFTTDNSPLISNVITDLAIDGRSGELFIATDRGLQSFRSDASDAGALHSNVKVFPNPVPPGYEGLVGFSGLAEDAIIKVTDVAGQLIFEGRANGGTASWDLRNYRGERAVMGIYLIFSASDDGTETFVTKLAVIH